MTKLSAADRSQIYTELTDATSPRTAEALMQNMVEAPWDNLVTKDHLDARFAQVDVRFAQIDVRFAEVDARFAQVDARFAELDATIERSMRKQTIWLISAMFTFNGLLAAWFAAFH